MKKLYISLVLSLTCFMVNAQTPAPTTQAFGKIDKADLELKSCDFEPDANAEVLFDKADIYFDQEFNIVNERHKRVKIFNDNGKKNADIRIEYYTANRAEYITGLQAQTINLVDGKVEITKIDKKQVFTEVVDKWRTALVFSFPNVKPGCVVEFKYRWTTVTYNIPDWYFQGKIPVRYSEVSTKIPEFFYYKPEVRVRQPFVKNINTTASESMGSGQNATTYNSEVNTRALANIHSLPDEPYMSSDVDNLQSLFYTLTSIKPRYGFTESRADTWGKIATVLIDDEDFGKQLKRKLLNEEALITKAKALKTDDQKIAYLFNEVKSNMKWDGVNRWYTNDGTVKAWEKKIGNCTEINLALCHLLLQAGVDARPMVVSTRDHGKVNQYNPLLSQSNKAVVYIRVDTAKYYVLDATNKYNLYNEVPDNLLNSSGLHVDKEKKVYDFVFLKKDEPVRQSYFVTAEIKPDGKMQGNTQISSFGYNKINRTSKYKTDGETKFIEYLKNKDNNLKIAGIKLENMEIDTLPLIQKIDFELDLTESDENYIYFNPNVLTSLNINPFLSENRFTDIDFGYRDNCTISGMYKLPAGYKVEGLPKSMSIVMPDKSMSFRRIVNQSEQGITVRYVVDHVKTIYFKEDYADFKEFCRQMYEMLNERIVLKKG
jgi:hypothetical protein